MFKLPLAWAAAVWIGTAAGAQAQAVVAGDLMIQQAWSRPTPAGAPVGAGYLTIVNTGKRADRLLSVSSSVAQTSEIHEMSMDGGIMRMRALPAGILIPAGQAVALAPGGFHLMLIGLRQPLKAGERVPAVLRFERAGAVTVELAVLDRPPAAAAGGR